MNGSEERTRQGKAMQPVKSCHLPATMGSCVKRGTGVAAGSCHVYFLDLATHFSKIEKNHFFLPGMSAKTVSSDWS